MIEPQLCPLCSAVCHIRANFNDVSYAHLDDRLLGLDDVPCTVVCQGCGHTRTARIEELDVSWTSGRIEFGTLVYD